MTIVPEFKKLGDYCKPYKNISFENYQFKARIQETEEPYDQCHAALQKLAEGCKFETVTPEKILHDRLLFGVQDIKLRGGLLRQN